MDQPIGFLLCDDLMFASRITGVGRDLDLVVFPARSSAGLIELARERPPRCVIVDLANPGLNIAEFVRQFRAVDSPPFIVAYGSHVDVAALKAARDAGCDLVLPRSKFVQDLPTAMPEWFGEK